MLGTSVIYDRGIDNNSGMHACTGGGQHQELSTKTGEDIGSSTQSENAVGQTSDDCRAKLAIKLSQSLASQVGSACKTITSAARCTAVNILSV